MNCIIIIICALLLVLSFGKLPTTVSYGFSEKRLFLLVLGILFFTKISLYFMFRKKSEKYGYRSIGGWRGIIGN